MFRLGFSLLLLLFSTAAFATSARVGDANYTIKPGDTTVVTTTTLTSARTWTLPSASSTCIGQAPCPSFLLLDDLAGAVNGGNTLSIAPRSGETINGSSTPLSVTASAFYTLMPQPGFGWLVLTNSAGGSGSGNVTEADSNTAGNMIIGAGGTAIQDITSIVTPGLVPGVLDISGTTTPTLAAGHLTIGGTMTAPTFGANAEGAIYMTTTGGLTVQGQGSTSDFALFNKSGTSVCIIGTGSTALTCTQYAVSGGSASGNRFYLSAANTPAISANSTLSQSWTSTGTTVAGSFSSAGGLILFDGSGNMSGNSLIVSGTSGPGVAAGILYLNGIITAPTFGANGEGSVYLSATNGIIVQGQGSGNDIELVNKSGTVACSIGTGTNFLTCGHFVPTASALAGNELYLPAANTMGIAANGTLAQQWTSAATTIPIALINTGITTDSAQTDATVCEDTTTHQFYFGSGTLGICKGTSSIRYKHDIARLDVGLDAIMKLEPVSYKLNADHGDPNHLLYGFTAEQGGAVLPDLMGRDIDGRPNTFDYLGVVPVAVKAIQQLNHKIEQQQAEIESLKRSLH